MGTARVAFNAVLIAAGLLLSAFLWLSASGNSPGFLPLGSATARPAVVTLARALPQRERVAPRRARRTRTNVAAPVVAIPVSSAVSVSASVTAPARPAARRHAPAQPAGTPPAATPPAAPPPPLPDKHDHGHGHGPK
jgi:hypothetical protein